MFFYYSWSQFSTEAHFFESQYYSVAVSTGPTWVTVNSYAGDHHHTYEAVDITRSVTLTVNSAYNTNCYNEVIKMQSCGAYDVVKGSEMEHNPAYDIVVQVEQNNSMQT